MSIGVSSNSPWPSSEFICQEVSYTWLMERDWVGRCIIEVLKNWHSISILLMSWVKVCSKFPTLSDNWKRAERFSSYIYSWRWRIFLSSLWERSMLWLNHCPQLSIYLSHPSLGTMLIDLFEMKENRLLKPTDHKHFIIAFLRIMSSMLGGLTLEKKNDNPSKWFLLFMRVPRIHYMENCWITKRGHESIMSNYTNY